ncbi:gliding motility-associated C-terminal domain-containing protein [Flavobacterium sp. ARAG 55.4]|uniref:T9SS type B sorting domain-containing protein n=1 Tax=Flavobacterium sp. ARAG 55.4 TaxID=3451357 RepID=UPI003F44E412
MIVKLLSFIKTSFIKCSFLFLCLLSTNSYSQCAGEDATVTICNIQDPVNKSINLFNLLGGSPIPDGTWIDNSKPLGDNTFNGILDAQSLRNSGIYSYTYVQDPSGCTNNQATVIVTIGPYAGVPSPNITTCDDVESFNLFQAFDGTQLAPQQNGRWTANNTPATLSGNIINPKVLGTGTYSYTYTIPALDTCPEQSATVSVSVFRKPVSGSPTHLRVCSTDDLTVYSNLNLNERLANEDAGGRWTELSGTSELSNSVDNIIDVTRIYNTLGAGTYSFRYTVLSSNPICTNSQSTVQIIIEDPLDFTGSTLVVNSDICEDEITSATYSATLTKGPQPIPDGNYNVTYSINNGSTTKNITVNGNFISGTFVFDVDRLNLPAVANYTFTIKNIVKTSSSGICNNIIGVISDVLSISPLPRINDATLTINPVCSGYDAEVEISGNTNLANGNYRIVYSLSGDNVASNQALEFTAVNGTASFSIPANLLTNVGTNIVFTINNIINLTTSCYNTATLSKGFIINATPDVSGISLDIKNECLEGDTVVELSGLGDVTNLTFDYSLTGANVSENQTISAEVNSGKASFIIPMSVLVNIGTTNFTLNSLIDDSNGCSAIVVDNNTASFTLDKCIVFIPDGFSPNGDTVNDTFRIPQIEFLYPDFSLEIFNRYGNILFKGNKNKPAWDGRNSDYKIGIDGVAPNGVYFYILHFNKGNKKPAQGRLYLNR